MFVLFILPAAYLALAEQNTSPIPHPMPESEPSKPSPEEQFNHLNQIASLIRSKLTDFQRQWLATQGEALSTSSERIMNDVLTEWLARHRDATRNSGSVGDILQEALDDFISRHHSEFLPVAFFD
jgi:hypothetical protein